MGPQARIAALIPHFHCEELLGDALASLMAQTRPLDAILVIDDGSDAPPIDLVGRFPGVTLLASEENVGPYALIQAAIDATDYDGYLFNDSDDWSAPERLELLLAEAERSGAELVGSYEVRILCEEHEVVPVSYPKDVNAALADQPSSFPLLHPTSLVARSLVGRIGGFATGMRFSGDAEFLRRAGHVARIVNVPRHLYFRRKRAGALTTAPDTGLRSPARREVQRVLSERASENAFRAARGESPDLTPLALRSPVPIRCVAGPPPRPATAVQPGLGVGRVLFGRRRDRCDSPRMDALGGGPPVFIVGAPRSGRSLLAWSLGQHLAFSALLEAGWIGSLGRTLLSVHAEAVRRGKESQLAFAGTSRAAFLGAFGPAATDLTGLPAEPGSSRRRWIDASEQSTFAIPALARLFEGAQFIHLVRDADAVVHSLCSSAALGGSYHSPENASKLWLRCVRYCLEAERALGAERMLRIRYEELRRQPEAELTRCLRFLGEQMQPECLRPLRLKPDVAAAGAVAPAVGEVGREAEQLSRHLQQEPPPSHSADDAAIERMERELLETMAGAGVAMSPERDPTPIDRLHAIVRAVVPLGARVLVVSKGDEELLRMEGVLGEHFPQAPNGAYAGYYPRDGAESVAHLEALCARGATYLLFPRTGFWWLDHYPELRTYLERKRLAVYADESCLLYDLRSEAAPASWPVSPVHSVEHAG